MGIGGWQQWLIVLVIVVLLFGRGKIPALMGDVAKGIKNFKNGMKDEVESAKDAADDAVNTVEHKAEDVVETVKDTAKKS